MPYSSIDLLSMAIVKYREAGAFFPTLLTPAWDITKKEAVFIVLQLCMYVLFFFQKKKA
jgi:hypothetical protein